MSKNNNLGPIRMNEDVTVEPNEKKEIEAILGGRKVKCVFENTYDIAYIFSKGEYEHKYLFKEIYALAQNGGKIIV